MSAENVIINFEGDTSGLTPVLSVLEAIVAEGGDIGTAMKKVIGDIKAMNTEITNGSKKAVSSIADIANITKTLDKQIIGGKYKKDLEDLKVALQVTGKELKGFYQGIIETNRANILAGGTKEEIKEFSSILSAAQEELAKLGEGSDETSQKIQSFKAELNEAKLALAAMFREGKAGTVEFTALEKKIGELTDRNKDFQDTFSRLGSDTKNIDGVISLVSGVAGGFAVAQGAAALFGNENEEVQKALLKVNAAMSILQGLQQVANVLQKESAASLLFTNTVRKKEIVDTAVQAAVTTELAGAEVVQGAATVGATAAQEGLNTAMKLNPAGLVIAGIVALVSAISYFSEAADRAAAKTKKLNENLAEQLDIDLKIIANSQGLQTQDKKIQKQKDYITLLQSQGASEKTLAAEKLKLDNLQGDRAKDYNQQLIDRGVTISSNGKDEVLGYEQAKTKAQDLRQEIENITKEQKKYLDAGKDGGFFSLNSTFAEDKKFKQLKLDKETKDGQLKNLETYVDAAKTAEESVGTTSEETANQIAETNKQAYLSSLKSAEAYAQERVSLAQKGSFAEIEAQINAAKISANTQVKSNPNITSGEIAKIYADANRQILELENQKHLKILENLKFEDEAKLAGVVKGSIKELVLKRSIAERDFQIQIDTLGKSEEEKNKLRAERTESDKEYNKQIAIREIEQQKSLSNVKLFLANKASEEEFVAKKAILEEEQKISLKNAEGLLEKTTEINAEYEKKKEDLELSHQQQIINNQISYDNAALDKFGITENEKLSIVLKRLDEQRQLEISQADKNAAKIAEINAKYDKQNIEAKKATIKAILDDNLRTLDVFTFKSIQANQRIVESQYTSGNAKIKALEQLQQFEDDKFDLQHKALTKQVEDGLLTAHEFDVAYQDLLNKRSESEEKTQKQITDIYIKETEKRVAFYKAGFAVLQKGLDAVLDTGAIKTALSEFQNVFTTITESIGKLKAILDDPNISPAEKAKARVDAFKDEAAAVIQATQAVVNQIFADSAAARQQALNDQLAMLEEQKQKELDNKNLTEQQKADIEEKYKQRERQEKIKAFNADKEAKKTQAVINGLLGVTNAFATAPTIIAGVILAALVAASTAIQVAKISSTPVPKFKSGKQKGSYEGFGIVDDGGKIEPILRADGSVEFSTGKPKERLTYLAKDDMVFSSMEHLYKHFSFPQIPSFVHPVNTNTQQIDYDKLAEAVANKMAGIIPSPTQIHNNFDGDEVKKFIINGNTKTEIKNKYFSMT